MWYVESFNILQPTWAVETRTWLFGVYRGLYYMDLYGDYYKILKGSKDPVLHQPVERNRIFHRISLLHFPQLAAWELWKNPVVGKTGELGFFHKSCAHQKWYLWVWCAFFSLKKIKCNLASKGDHDIWPTKWAPKNHYLEVHSEVWKLIFHPSKLWGAKAVSFREGHWI